MMNILDKFHLTVHLIATTMCSIGSLIFPDVFEWFIEYHIKKINIIMNNANGDSEYSNYGVQDEVRSQGSRTCDVDEESAGSCCDSEHEYDKVSSSETDQSESDEGEVTSR